MRLGVPRASKAAPTHRSLGSMCRKSSASCHTPEVTINACITSSTGHPIRSLVARIRVRMARESTIMSSAAAACWSAGRARLLARCRSAGAAAGATALWPPGEAAPPARSAGGRATAGDFLEPPSMSCVIGARTQSSVESGALPRGAGARRRAARGHAHIWCTAPACSATCGSAGWPISRLSATCRCPSPWPRGTPPQSPAACGRRPPCTPCWVRGAGQVGRRVGARHAELRGLSLPLLLRRLALDAAAVLPLLRLVLVTQDDGRQARRAGAGRAARRGRLGRLGTPRRAALH